jgi:archaellum biogenesis ATPase FlaH
MVKEELIQRSPIRIFEKSINGGLKAGEIGIIASSSGIGKTSVLVQLALDQLLQAQKVIHVSFTQHTDYVLAWYEDIFDEFIKKQDLAASPDIKNELVKNRVLMNFNQGGITGEQILRSLRAMILEGGFKAETLIIDGFDFSQADYERIAQVKAFAKELGLSVWYSCNVKGEKSSYNQQKIPHLIKDYQDLVDVVIVLEAQQEYITFSVSKDRNTYNPEALALRLDPRTLLLLEG